jgi:hypothetical protein
MSNAKLYYTRRAIGPSPMKICGACEKPRRCDRHRECAISAAKPILKRAKRAVVPSGDIDAI